MSYDVPDDDIDRDDGDSGPYCIHWDDLVDCDDLCQCRHKCREHFYGGRGECNVCGCAEFVEPHG